MVKFYKIAKKKGATLHWIAPYIFLRMSRPKIALQKKESYFRTGQSYWDNFKGIIYQTPL